LETRIEGRARTAGFFPAAIAGIASRYRCQLKAHEQNGAENQRGKTEQKQVRPGTARFIV